MEQTVTSSTDASPAVRSVDWKSATWAGLIAGSLFMLAEMIMVAAFEGQSPWAPPRMIAAMLLGKDALASLDFDALIVITGMLIHFALSLAYAFLLALVLQRARAGKALLIGSAFGVAIYLVNFYPVADAMFPWFAMARGWISVTAHVLFGAAAAYVYVTWRRA